MYGSSTVGIYNKTILYNPVVIVVATAERKGKERRKEGKEKKEKERKGKIFL